MRLFSPHFNDKSCISPGFREISLRSDFVIPYMEKRNRDVLPGRCFRVLIRHGTIALQQSRQSCRCFNGRQLSNICPSISSLSFQSLSAFAVSTAYGMTASSSILPSLRHAPRLPSRLLVKRLNNGRPCALLHRLPRTLARLVARPKRRAPPSPPAHPHPTHQHSWCQRRPDAKRSRSRPSAPAHPQTRHPRPCSERRRRGGRTPQASGRSSAAACTRVMSRFTSGKGPGGSSAVAREAVGRRGERLLGDRAALMSGFVECCDVARATSKPKLPFVGPVMRTAWC